MLKVEKTAVYSDMDVDASQTVMPRKMKCKVGARMQSCLMVLGDGEAA